MKLFILKTNITQNKVSLMAPIFDTEDIDRVLKVETKGNLTENNVINLIRTNGFYCDVLPD